MAVEYTWERVLIFLFPGVVLALHRIPHIWAICWRLRLCLFSHVFSLTLPRCAGSLILAYHTSSIQLFLSGWLRFLVIIVCHCLMRLQDSKRVFCFVPPFFMNEIFLGLVSLIGCLIVRPGRAELEYLFLLLHCLRFSSRICIICFLLVRPWSCLCLCGQY